MTGDTVIIAPIPGSGIAANDDACAISAGAAAGDAPHRRNGEAEFESIGVVAPTTTTEDDVTPTTGHIVTPVAESETVEPAYVNDVMTIDETESHGTGAIQIATQLFATIDEAAVLLRIERKAVYRLAQRGELPGCRRLGHSFRVHVPSVLQWFASGPRTDRKRGKSR
jgi:excisionase family DNA binding protein